MSKVTAGGMAARIAALSVAASLAVVAGHSGYAGPGEGVELMVGGYGLSLLTFASFPRLRRNDLVMALGALFLALSLLRYLDGAPAAAAPLLFGLVGAAAAWLPSRIDRFRREERREERRRGRRVSDLISQGARVRAPQPDRQGF